MSARKERLTVTVDPELIEAGNIAVASGFADSLSAWVNQAMADRAVQDRHLIALAQAIEDYEAEFGSITLEEIEAQQRADREAAVVVRGKGTQGKDTRGKGTRGKGTRGKDTRDRKPRHDGRGAA